MIYSLSLIVCGALGAFVKETIDDNTIELPKKIEGKLFLGFVGSIIVGAVLGYVVDNSPITAFFGGYAGLGTIERLLKSRDLK